MENQKASAEKPTRTAFYIRVTEKEYARVMKMCSAMRKNPQELFKTALLDKEHLGEPVYLMTPEQAKEFGAALNRVGNNINQIARQFNSGLMNGWSQQLNSVVRAFVDLRHMLMVNRANR